VENFAFLRRNDFLDGKKKERKKEKTLYCKKLRTSVPSKKECSE